MDQQGSTGPQTGSSSHQGFIHTSIQGSYQPRPFGLKVDFSIKNVGYPNHEHITFIHEFNTPGTYNYTTNPRHQAPYFYSHIQPALDRGIARAAELLPNQITRGQNPPTPSPDT